MSELQLSFHSTFALKKQDLLKILVAANEQQALKDTLSGLVERTGLGTKKVTPFKSWAIRAGLISHNTLSPEGKLVLQFDPYLESVVTEWLMHFYLSFSGHGMEPPPNHPADWGGWSYFVFSFLPEHPEFSQDELVAASARVFSSATPKVLHENFRILLRAYTEGQALWACRFLQTVDSKHYRQGGIDTVHPYLMGYFLAKLWQRDFEELDSVPLDTLLNQPMGLAPILGTQLNLLQNRLTKLEHYGLIFYSSGTSDTVTRRWKDPLLLLERAYT
jgi:hypothetical protein